MVTIVVVVVSFFVVVHISFGYLQFVKELLWSLDAHVCCVCGQVLSRDGKAVELSEKLTPGNAKERARIEAAGGWITEER